METISTRIKRKLRSNKTGALLFAGLFGVTALFIGGTDHLVHAGGGAVINSPAPVFAAIPRPRIANLSEVAINAKLSQSKLIQATDGTFYLNIDIDSPELKMNKSIARQPSDVIVVLDTSGSMAQDKKLPYAKEAIIDLVDRLNDGDRFALITFSNGASLQFAPATVTPSTRTRVRQIVSGIRSGGGTNMGEGIRRAQQVLRDYYSDDSKRVVLLSDGHANQGVSDPAGLASLVGEVTKKEAVFSTIGMGLGFNETLMSSLADHGMGAYSYLEHLSGLGDTFARVLSTSQNIYAANTELRFQLSDGMKVVDASGYPFKSVAGTTNTIAIPTGQLLGGSRKSFMITLKVPTGSVGDYSVGQASLHYSVGEEQKTLEVPKTQLAFAVVEPAKRAEAVASIDRGVYSSSWNMNNLGLMQKKFHRALKDGDRSKAKAAISSYRSQLQQAEAQSGMQIIDPKTEQELRAMDTQLDDAFTGSASEQAVKQNRLGKGIWSKSRGNQYQSW